MSAGKDSDDDASEEIALLADKQNKLFSRSVLEECGWDDIEGGGRRDKRRVSQGEGCEEETDVREEVKKKTRSDDPGSKVNKNDLCIPGPAGKLPDLDPDEIRDLFNREAERELRRTQRVRMEVFRRKADGREVDASFKKQLAEIMDASDDFVQSAVKLASECVAWKNMLDVYPQYRDYKKINDIDMPKLKGVPFKIPSLVVLIDKFKKMERGAGVVFRNYHGEIRGGIDRSVLKLFGNDITHGAVLHLQEISVFRPTIGSTFLNVTSNNVVCLFPASGTPKCIRNPNLISPTSPTVSGSLPLPTPASPDLLAPTVDQRNIFDCAKFFDVPTEEELERILASDDFGSDEQEFF